MRTKSHSLIFQPPVLREPQVSLYPFSKHHPTSPIHSLQLTHMPYITLIKSALYRTSLCASFTVSKCSRLQSMLRHSLYVPFTLTPKIYFPLCLSAAGAFITKQLFPSLPRNCLAPLILITLYLPSLLWLGCGHPVVTPLFFACIYACLSLFVPSVSTSVLPQQFRMSSMLNFL